MLSSEKYFDPDVLARLGGIEVRARTVVEGIISGLHRSPYSGQSAEFVDHREYVPGDDPRHIDWKVFGRANRIVIKRFEEETNLLAHILLDASASMRFSAGGRLPKFEYAATLAACFAYLIERQKDPVGLAVFDSAVRERVPLSARTSGLLRIAEVLAGTRPERKTSLAGVLVSFAEELPRRGLIVIVSDLLVPLPDIEAGLRELAARRHEVIVFQVLDRAELEFPFEGSTLFEGLEGDGRLLADPRGLRDAYLESLGRFLAGVREACARHRIDYRLLHTGEPLDGAVISVAQARARHLRRSR